MKKRILSLLIALMLMVALVPGVAVFALEEGAATGTFSNNNVPSITSVM